MANEWTKTELFGANNDGQLIRYTIANNDSVSKGSLLAIKDARTASLAVVTDLYYAGVAAMDKEAGDGSTSISVFTDGIFNAVASGSIAVGQAITGAEANKVKVFAAGASGAAILGYALNTTTTGQTALVRIRL